MLMLNYDFTKSVIEFTSNEKINIFVAFPENKSNPLDEDYLVYFV